jgi:Fic family protein
MLARAEADLELGRTPGPTAREILANIDAMELAIGDGATAGRFELADIRAIHARLMAHALNAERIAGVIRTTQNWIGGNDYTPCGADFVPPPADDVPRLLDDLCDAINDDVLPPLVQAALVHAQFETIHPFADGNGRTGRALIHVVLRRRGVATRFVPPISVVLARARGRYVDGLTAFRRDAAGVATWIEQFAAAAHAAALLAERYVSRVEALREEWRSRLTAAAYHPRSDAAAWAIIDVLPAHPIITGPVAVATTGRAKSQVYEGLALLERHGILQPLGAAKRNRAWEADGLLPLIEMMESGDA